MEPLSPGVIFTPLLLIFKILYWKIGDIAVLYVLIMFGDTKYLKALAQMPYPKMFCLYFIFYMHILLLHTIFDTKIYSAMNLRDSRNLN